MAAVRLLGMSPSPFVMRARFALGLKKVPYEFVEENIFQKSELLMKSNPVYKKIPVLLHGERSICESMIIVEYVDDVWKDEDVPALLPPDPYDKAVARFWAAYIDDKWFPSVKGLATAKSPEEAAEAIEPISVSLQLLEDVLSMGNQMPFFGGETAGYLDVALGGWVPWMRAIEKLAGVSILDEAKTPLLVAWVERFLGLEDVKVVVPEMENILELFSKVKEKMAPAAAPK